MAGHSMEIVLFLALAQTQFCLRQHGALFLDDYRFSPGRKTTIRG
jgi:hypothetical protein